MEFQQPHSESPGLEKNSPSVKTIEENEDPTIHHAEKINTDISKLNAEVHKYGGTEKLKHFLSRLGQNEASTEGKNHVKNSILVGTAMVGLSLIIDSIFDDQVSGDMFKDQIMSLKEQWVNAPDMQSKAVHLATLVSTVLATTPGIGKLVSSMKEKLHNSVGGSRQSAETSEHAIAA